MYHDSSCVEYTDTIYLSLNANKVDCYAAPIVSK